MAMPPFFPERGGGEKGKIKLPPNNGVWQEEPPVLPLQYTNLANQTLETIKPRIQLGGGGIRQFKAKLDSNFKRVLVTQNGNSLEF